MVFLATLVGLAIGRLGRLPAPRGAIALVGGLASAALLGTPWDVIDLQVIALLVGLMVLAALAKETGCFRPVARVATMRPALAVATGIGVMAASSALLLNDAAVVVLMPVLLVASMRAGAAPVPTAALLGAASNVGSLLTPFGNPQNAILASISGQGVWDFLRHQAPVFGVAFAGLLVAAAKVPRIARSPAPEESPMRRDAAVVVLAVLGFIAAAALHAPLGLAAAGAAAAAYLVLRTVRGQRMDGVALGGIEANVVALFIGMYLLTGGIDRWLDVSAIRLEGLRLPATTGLVFLLSNTLGNVPSTLTLSAIDLGWTRSHAQYLVSVTTLGGTVFLSGSAATILAADQARRLGIELSFSAYLRWSWVVLPAVVFGAWWQW